MIRTKLNLRYYGNPCLREQCAPITSIGPAEKVLIESMFLTMEQEKGIGLAAPQVGVNKQLFVLDLGEKQGDSWVVINPKIVKTKGAKTVLEEGCLSIPEVLINVKRPEIVEVEFMNEQGKNVSYEFSGLLAKAFQHEYDHLQGTLITDYASKAELSKYALQLKQLESKIKK